MRMPHWRGVALFGSATFSVQYGGLSSGRSGRREDDTTFAADELVLAAAVGARTSGWADDELALPDVVGALALMGAGRADDELARLQIRDASQPGWVSHSASNDSGGGASKPRGLAL